MDEVLDGGSLDHLDHAGLDPRGEHEEIVRQARRAPARGETGEAGEAWDRGGLPGWCYHSEELLELEKEELFRRHWQLVCHTSDVAEPGDYVALDIVGERALVVRGADGTVRAFHNLCPHRGSRVVAEDRGQCGKAITCPFHGWTFNLDGTLRGPANPASLPKLDPVAFGLKPVETCFWHGFVFVRFKPGPQPQVADIMARFEEEMAPYDVASMVPTDGFEVSEAPVNWKAVRDVDNEGYHVPMAHPGLQELYGPNYYDEDLKDGANRSYADFSHGADTLWSVRGYKRLLPEAHHLPPSHRRAWVYLGLFPNAVLGLYPDCVKFYQEFPIGASLTVQRGATYRPANEDRHWRAARYLSERIDRLTSAEDELLTVWSSQASHSSAYGRLHPLRSGAQRARLSRRAPQVLPGGRRAPPAARHAGRAQCATAPGRQVSVPPDLPRVARAAARSSGPEGPCGSKGPCSEVSPK